MWLRRPVTKKWTISQVCFKVTKSIRNKVFATECFVQIQTKNIRMSAHAKFFWTIILSPAVSTRGWLGMDKNRKGICEVLFSYPPGLYFLFQRFLSQMQFPCNPWCIPFPELCPIFLCTHKELDPHHPLSRNRASLLPGVEKITYCLFSIFNGNFLNNILTPTFFKFSLIFTFSGEKKMRGCDQNTPQRSGTIKKSYNDCTAELMFGISIPTLFLVSNGKESV